MSEIAPNIERIYPEAAPSAAETYVFKTDTEPPRFARVDVWGDDIFWGVGPLTKEQLDVALSGDEQLTVEQQAVIDNPNSFGYRIDFGENGCEGEYPGGRDRLALNIARLVLGA